MFRRLSEETLHNTGDRRPAFSAFSVVNFGVTGLPIRLRGAIMPSPAQTWDKPGGRGGIRWLQTKFCS